MIFDGERTGSLSHSCIYVSLERYYWDFGFKLWQNGSYSDGVWSFAVAWGLLRSKQGFPPVSSKYATHGYTWLHMATHGLHMGYTWLHMCYMCKMGFLYVLHMYELVFFGFTHGYTWLHTTNFFWDHQLHGMWFPSLREDGGMNVWHVIPIHVWNKTLNTY